MKIRTGDIYRVQSAKYNFCSQFVSGKVLDITCGKYLDFLKSDLLLKNGAKEVLSLDLLNDDQFITTRYLEKEKIVCQIKNKKELDSMSFDTILAFDVLSTVDNFDDTLKFISKKLKHNGTIIISIVNDDGYDDNIHDLFTKDLTLFSKNDFEKNLQNYFNTISFFSQGIIISKKMSELRIKTTVKIKLRNFFLKSVNNLNFYLKYIKPIQNYFNTFQQNLAIKKTQKYNITPFNEEKQSLFVIAVCKNS